MIKYLRNPSDKVQQHKKKNYLKTLNIQLIKGYTSNYRRLAKSPDYQLDSYNCQYLIHHAILTEDQTILKQVMEDFNWMTNKIRLDGTIHNLCMDITECVDYLKKKNIQVHDISSNINLSSESLNQPSFFNK